MTIASDYSNTVDFPTPKINGNATERAPKTGVLGAVQEIKGDNLVSASDLIARWVSKSECVESLINSCGDLFVNQIWNSPASEPNFLLSAFRHLANDQVKLMVVEHRTTTKKCSVVGLIPFQKKRIYGLPISSMEVWKHDQCFDSTPLLHKTFATNAWSAACRFLAKEGISLLSLDTVSDEPAFQRVLHQSASDLGQTIFYRDRYQRAAFRPAENADAYINSFVSKSVRKKQRRHLRRLSEVGDVEWIQSSPSTSDFDKLASEFLELEASGWKGRNRTALNSNPNTAQFYRGLIQGLARCGNARFLTLKVAGKPIAMLSDLQIGNSIYAYKTAYDEQYSDFSPGVLAEIENIRNMHCDGIEYADSCTEADNSTINRIWGQKVAFQKSIISLRPGISKLVVRAFPKMQSLARVIKRK